MAFPLLHDIILSLADVYYGNRFKDFSLAAYAMEITGGVSLITLEPWIKMHRIFCPAVSIRGLTSAGYRNRGLGHGRLGSDKSRPSIRSNGRHHRIIVLEGG